MISFLRKWRYRYRLIDKIPPQSNSKPKPWSTFSALFLWFLCFLLIAGPAFFAGAFWFKNRIYVLNHLDLVVKPQTFQYNRTFGDRPNKQTNQAWDSLFPKQGGYFRHPGIASKRSALAVFHQLHCLDGIRHGYWAMYDLALEGEKLIEDDIAFMFSPSHIRHCVDLLRHSLMCQPDLTVEVKDLEKGGVNGFGTEHQCINWEQIMGWVSKWETYGQHKGKGGHTNEGHTHKG